MRNSYFFLHILRRTFRVRELSEPSAVPKLEKFGLSLEIRFNRRFKCTLSRKLGLAQKFGSGKKRLIFYWDKLGVTRYRAAKHKDILRKEMAAVWCFVSFHQIFFSF